MERRQDPGIYRRRVRTALRQAREEAHRTQQEAADALDWSLSKVIRIEAGTVTVSVSDLRALLAYYKVTDAQLQDELVDAARRARGNPWWHPYRDVIRKQFVQLLTYEIAAISFRAYHPSLINGLLTTTDYMQATRPQMMDADKTDKLGQLIEFLIKRQQVFFDEVAPEATFIIDEAALRRWIGGPRVMLDQITHLRGVAARDHVTLKIYPFKAGSNAALSGPFILTEFSEHSDMTGTGVYLEGASNDLLGRAGNGVTNENSQRVAQYSEIFADLDRRSLSTGETDALLQRLIEEYKAAANS